MIQKLGPDYLINLFANVVADRVCLSDSELAILDSTVLEFITRNELAMRSIVRDEALVSKDPNFVRKLLILARLRTRTPAERMEIEKLAMDAGFDDLFHPA